MRIIVGAFAVIAMTATVAFAQPVAPLTAGKPAGVKHAQDETNTLLVVGGVGIVVLGVALVASSKSAAPTPAPATSDTSSTDTSSTSTTGS